MRSLHFIRGGALWLYGLAALFFALLMFVIVPALADLPWHNRILYITLAPDTAAGWGLLLSLLGMAAGLLFYFIRTRSLRRSAGLLLFTAAYILAVLTLAGPMVRVLSLHHVQSVRLGGRVYNLAYTLFSGYPTGEIVHRLYACDGAGLLCEVVYSTAPRTYPAIEASLRGQPHTDFVPAAELLPDETAGVLLLRLDGEDVFIYQPP